MDNQSTRSTREVAILVHTANDWTRSVLRGAVYYARENRRWKLFLEPRGFHELLALPPRWQGDGVILRLTHEALLQDIQSRGLPAVNVSWLGQHQRAIPKVVSDERSCAQLAVDHLRSKGFPHLAYVGPSPALDYGDTMDVTCQELADSAAFNSLRPMGAKTARIQSIRRWLKALPRPVGIVAWNAETCRDLLEACEQLELHVPGDVGIVCIEHDHLMASIAGTPLTSIDQNPMRVGYEAARVLDAMMHGAEPPPGPTLVQPLGVICRQSTDRSATNDELVKSALRFIQEHFSQPIQVPHLCSELKISRRQLEDRFRTTIKSSPAREIRRTRLEHVKRLLVETEFRLDRIASLTGFEHAEVMMRAFKREFGQTAGEFRRLGHARSTPASFLAD